MEGAEPNLGVNPSTVLLLVSAASLPIPPFMLPSGFTSSAALPSLVVSILMLIVCWDTEIPSRHDRYFDWNVLPAQRTA